MIEVEQSDGPAMHRSRRMKMEGSILFPIEDVEARVRKPRDGRRRFIIPSVLPAGPCFLYGASGSGKSGIAINIALAVASGRAWAGLEIEQASVLYLPAEDRFGIEERLVAASEAAGLSSLELALAVADFEGIPAAIDLKREADRMQDQTGLPVRLIIIDTFGAAYGDKSQDDAGAASGVMNQINRITQKLQCCVLCLHHTGKGNGAGMRGSQVFFDRADAVIRADRRADFTALEVEKLRNGPRGASFRFEIAGYPLVTADGTIDVQVVDGVRPMTEDDRAARAERIERAMRNQSDIALSRLIEIATAGKASIERWRTECYGAWADKSDDSKRKAFNRARGELVKAGKIAASGDTVTLTGTAATCPVNVPQFANDERDSVTVTSPPSLEGVSRPVSHDPRMEEKEHV